jgi:hypothetical protein
MAKTIKVRDVISLANDFMASSPDSAAMDRLHVADFVKNLLHEARAYAGFGYLTAYGSAGNDPSRVQFHFPQGSK